MCLYDAPFFVASQQVVLLYELNFFHWTKLSQQAIHRIGLILLARDCWHRAQVAVSGDKSYTVSGVLIIHGQLGPEKCHFKRMPFNQGNSARKK